MKKHAGLLAAVQLMYVLVFCQHDYLQRPTLGICFLFHDFKASSGIRNTSLGSMSPGLAINYLNGFSNHFDFSATLTGSFLDYTLPNGRVLGDGGLLMEGDLSCKAKLLSNKHPVTPFGQLGVGVSKFKQYWGLLLPAGIGVQVNFFEEAYFIVNAQYRLGITNQVTDHFFYSFGLAGTIGGRRKENTVLPSL